MYWSGPAGCCRASAASKTANRDARESVAVATRSRYLSGRRALGGVPSTLRPHRHRVTPRQHRHRPAHQPAPRDLGQARTRSPALHPAES
jgi:hypothetical protein